MGTINITPRGKIDKCTRKLIKNPMRHYPYLWCACKAWCFLLWRRNHIRVKCVKQPTYPSTKGEGECSMLVKANER